MIWVLKNNSGYQLSIPKNMDYIQLKAKKTEKNIGDFFVNLYWIFIRMIPKILPQIGQK